MKKFFYSVLAAATMLFATTSCSEDDPMTPEIGHDGKTQKVTFKVEMPGETASRTLANGAEVGQGNMANTLRYALYEVDAEGKAVVNANAQQQPRPLKTGLVTESSDKVFTVDIDMVKGLNYKILFLAYSDNCIFKLDAEDNDGDGSGDDLLSLELIDDAELLSNQESYDAFVACHPYAINDHNRSNNVTLYRPFAQINLGTTDADLKKAIALQANVTASQLLIKNAGSEYNVFEGKVTSHRPLTYIKSAILTNQNDDTPDNGVNEILSNVDGKNYNYLNMVYVLAGTDDAKSSTHTVEYTLYRDAAPQVVRTFQIDNLPIERNFRTNIVGDILTQTEKFNIVIDAIFETPDYNIIYAGGTAANPDKLENAMEDINNNAVEDAVIKIPAGSYVSWNTGAGHGSTPLVNVDNTVTKTVTIQGEGESSVLVAEGAGVGALRAANGAKLIFKNLTIVDNSVSYNENAWELTYLEFAGNLEFENVTFKGGITLQREDNDVDLNATFNNCTFITEEASVYGVWVSDGNSTFTDCNFKGTRGLKMHEDYGSEIASVTIDGCAFGPISKKPGIAIGDLNSATTVTIKNSSFNGCQAGDQGNYIYETDTDVTTFTFVNENNTVNPIATTADEFNALLADANFSEFFLGEDVVIEGTFTINRDVKISSVNPDKKATIKGRVEIRSVNPTFENVKFDRNETDSNNAMQTASNALQYKAVVMIYGDQTNTITFKACDFYNNNGTHKSAITNVACNLVVDGCYFEGKSSSIYSQTNLSITNSKFNYTGGNNVIVSLNGCGEAGGKFVFTGNEIVGEKIFALSQFLSTVGFGNGVYHFDVKNNTGAGFDHYFLNTTRVANKTFEQGSETF